MIKVTYLDHSGFALTTPDVIMVFDFYKDPVKALHKVLDEHPSLPVVFFVSHHHEDHFNESIFELAQNHQRCYILSRDVFSKNVPRTGIAVQYATPGDELEQLPGGIHVRVFGSTDAGVCYAVTLPDQNVVFHAGDLNDWHWNEESTEREIHKAEEEFNVILHRIAEAFPVMRIAMFPVDARQGKDFARGATMFLSAIKVDNFFPMHFFGEPQKACEFDTYNPTPSTHCYCLDKVGKSVDIVY